MKRQICIGLAISAILGVLGLTPGVAQRSQYDEDWTVISAGTTSPASAPWFIETVDSTGDIGRHASVAVDPGSGMTFISYHDRDEGGTLNLARYLGSGGDCGPDNAWNCQLLDSFGSPGEYNAIATYPSGDGVKIIVSYYNSVLGALKYVDGYAEGSDFSWSVHTIDSGDPPGGILAGLHTSVKFDSAGVPHIAYQRYGISSIEEEQWYAYWVGNGTGNCGEVSVADDWQCGAIHSDEGVGMHASLDLDGDDDPSIAYYDSIRGHPWVAQYIGAGGNCGPSNDWYCRKVHRPTLDIGQYVSLYVEDSGLPHIAYHNVTNGSLEYAEWVGSGGNCGFNGASLQWQWQCDEIDDTGTSLTSMGVAIAGDEAGYPIVVYQDGSEDLAPAALKMARPHVALDPNVVPNCGPQDLFLTWRCDIIDGGGSYADEAGSASLFVNSAGLATIAYHELDTYAYPVEGNLKAAYQRLQVFLPLGLKNW